VHRFLPTLGLALLAVIAAACSDTPRAIEDAEVLPFSDAYELSDSVTFAQSDSLPLVDVTHFDRRRDGTFAVADAGEGNVRLYALNGTLLRIIGRKGNGPGEFLLPMTVRWDSRDRLHVLDGQRLEIALFSPTGDFIRVVSLSEIGATYNFAVLPSGDYAFLLARDGRDILQTTDSLAQPRRSMLPIARYMPPGQDDEAAWRMERSAVMDVSGDTARVALTIADSVWTAALQTASSAAASVRPPAYLQPKDPERPLGDPAYDEAWSATFERVIGVARMGDRTIVTFSKTEGEGIKARLVEVGSERVRVLENAPAVTRGMSDRLVSVRPAEDRYTVLFWKPKG
jgi:hypothetical protein